MNFVYELAGDNSMIPQGENEKYEIYAGPSGRILHAHQTLDANTVASMRREKITSLHINSYDIKGDIDLCFLNLMPELQAFSIFSEKPVDWMPIQSLKNLKKLTIRARGPKPQPLDFTRFKQLHTLRVTWHPEWESMLACKSLRGLTIENSKKIKEFDLRGLPQLKELCLTECLHLRRTICSPKQSIESLGIASCRSFQSVEPFEAIRDLRYCVLGGNSCFEIESLGKCAGLKRLSMNGIGKIRSLTFLSNCSKLERLAMHFSTQIEDGDLTVLLKLPKLKAVSFKRYKNYTHTLEELKSAIQT